MTLPVFFCPEMVARVDSFSPSAEKPARVAADWLARGLPVRITTPTPATVADLERAHASSYVRGVLDCRLPNGFGTRSAEVAASLPWTSGAMLSAARSALSAGGFAAALCSGFHHAGWDRGGGFCTFNGLMVTACALLADDGVENVAILDCDMHYGDGTEDIIRRLGLAGRVHHVTIGARYGDRADARTFLDELPTIVRSLEGARVLLYQAGADPHVRDPLGGFLDDDELRERDETVFRTARSIGLPVAWNLAGGYQRDERGGIDPVLAIHAATAATCLSFDGRHERARA